MFASMELLKLAWCFAPPGWQRKWYFLHCAGHRFAHGHMCTEHLQLPLGLQMCFQLYSCVKTMESRFLYRYLIWEYVTRSVTLCGLLTSHQYMHVHTGILSQR